MKALTLTNLTNQKIRPMKKFLQANKQTDKWTDGQTKNYMPPIYRWGGEVIQLSTLKNLCLVGTDLNSLQINALESEMHCREYIGGKSVAYEWPMRRQAKIISL